MFFGSSCVAHTSMVPSGHGDVGRRPLYSSESTESFYTRKGESAPSVEKVNSDGLSTVRQTLQKRKASTRSATIIMASWRSGTQKQYNMYIRKWFQYSCQRKISSFQVSINDILDFLAELFENGLKYSAINSVRLALSAVGLVYDGFTAGAHPLVIRFLKGVYNIRPPVARYNEIWDVGIVLNYLKTLHISELSLKLFTLKLTILIALTTASSSQSLHLLTIDNMVK